MHVRAFLPRLLVLAVIGILAGGGVAEAAGPGMPVDCHQGEFCVWAEESFGAQVERLDLRTANPEECVLLPGELAGKSFVNLMDREVTVYQDSECSTEGDFTTYPGQGTFVPRAPFLVRAVTIWDPGA
ncbi:peptidase inhibitor family I36 protein [Amycolatopsis cynarae]|uniref:Peptidase inhibitor family I36 protein n=1 Tax=Amycolatopsis cynarae TaxID=2995223 RepID=A0ABY7AZS8_9PSEU|nr:peptidase inhibitor family I36 protein [Amycolatopsis sp. HUAS 11-8]WAL64171.1 peptidase inhibitor family I36 protein [Amycolatopsis sp. HUAS 11-8]